MRAQCKLTGLRAGFRHGHVSGAVPNPGEETPTLAYGTATGVGPFLCEWATAGVTCTTGGRGFRISASGITSASA